MKKISRCKVKSPKFTYDIGNMTLETHRNDISSNSLSILLVSYMFSLGWVFRLLVGISVMRLVSSTSSPYRWRHRPFCGTNLYLFGWITAWWLVVVARSINWPQQIVEKVSWDLGWPPLAPIHLPALMPSRACWPARRDYIVNTNESFCLKIIRSFNRLMLRRHAPRAALALPNICNSLVAQKLVVQCCVSI